MEDSRERRTLPHQHVTDRGGATGGLRSALESRPELTLCEESRVVCERGQWGLSQELGELVRLYREGLELAPERHSGAPCLLG